MSQRWSRARAIEQGCRIHAQAHVRPSAGRCRARYAAASVVAWSRRYQAHGALQRTERESVVNVWGKAEGNPNGAPKSNSVTHPHSPIDWTRKTNPRAGPLLTNQNIT